MDVLRIRGARTHNLKRHRSRPAARPAHRHHGPVRLRQVLAGVRHDLRRGPAPLRRVAVRVRAAVPLGHGKAGRRPHRGPVARDRDRAEGDLAQPPLDGRHRHRDLRLPARAVCAGRRAALPGARPGPGRAVGQPDGRPGHGAAGRHGRAAARADRAGPQGRAHRDTRDTAQPGFRARAGRRQAHRTRGAPAARCAPPPLDRGRRRPAEGAARRRAAARGVVRDGARARAGHGARRVPRRAGPRADAVLESLRLHDLRLQPDRARAAPVLVQQPERRVRHLRRARRCRNSSIPRAWS